MTPRGTIYIKVGQKIAFLRKQAGLSQECLALEVGINRTYVGMIEQGKKRASLEILQAIAQTLGTKLIALFEEGSP
jgi:transcriptional regulator with XRE-family HTH domain